MLDANTIIRQIQLSLITGTPNSTITWFKNLWNNLDVIHCNIFHNDTGECIYYTKNNKRPVFYMDNANGQVIYDYGNYSIYFYTQNEFEYISTTRLQDITVLLLSIVLGDENPLLAMQGHLGSIGEINDILHGI